MESNTFRSSKNYIFAMNQKNAEMKKLMYLMPLVLFVFLLTNCNNGTGTDEGTGNDTLATDTLAMINIADFEKVANEYTGKEIQIEGTVTHICRHSGKALYIMDDNSLYSVQISASENLAEFDTLMEGKRVIITGTVDLFVVDSAYIAEKEKEYEALEAIKKEKGDDTEDMTESHHGSIKEQMENYKVQMEMQETDRLEFYSVICNKIEVKE